GVGVLVRFPTGDATNNFRLYDAALVNELGIESAGGFEVALELTAKAFRRGERIAEVPTTWRDRVAGESRFKFRKWLPKYAYWYGYALLAGIERRLSLIPSAVPRPATPPLAGRPHRSTSVARRAPRFPSGGRPRAVAVPPPPPLPLRNPIGRPPGHGLGAVGRGRYRRIHWSAERVCGEVRLAGSLPGRV